MHSLHIDHSKRVIRSLLMPEYPAAISKVSSLLSLMVWEVRGQRTKGGRHKGALCPAASVTLSAPSKAIHQCQWYGLLGSDAWWGCPRALLGSESCRQKHQSACSELCRVTLASHSSIFFSFTYPTIPVLSQGSITSATASMFWYL